MSLFSKKGPPSVSIEEQKLTKKLNRFDFFCGIACTIVLVLLLVMNFRLAVIPSASMYPTLAVGEAALCRVADASDIDHDSIIIFTYHYDNGYSEQWCKRLIGKPGDTIMVTHDGVYRNGEFLTEPYRLYGNIDVAINEPITLGENEYFVMGDNRNNSTDSRMIAPISGDDIIGYSIAHARFFEDKNLLNFLNSISIENRNENYRGN